MLRSNLKEWKALESDASNLAGTHINSFFKNDSKRFDKFHLSHGSCLFDYSKQLVTQEVMGNLINLAKACDLESWRDKMFAGAYINTTEKRAVLHTALRSKSEDPILVDGHNIKDQIKPALDKMKAFSDKIRHEKRFSNIINIGIGGSNLGSAMVCEALKPFSDKECTQHFVSNVDAAHLSESLLECVPEKTLFIISSKTFSTLETITNALSARTWLQEKLGKEDVSDHFIACSQNIEAAKNFGVKEEYIFPMWDWVGGRYSLWSAIGLPICISIGFERFREFLDGAEAIDNHFESAPLEKNMPVIMALLGVWQRNFLNYSALSIAPYSHSLLHFPTYAQQLDMESNGKSIDRDNQKIDYQTGPIILGQTGTDAQHAYFQHLHQGTQITPCDFIAFVNSQYDIPEHQEQLLANALAQSKAMMEGRDHEDPNKKFIGNRPSSTLILESLTPYNLGTLLALYEHKVFVQGVIWNINSFDQCGVELGKVLAKDIMRTSLDAPDSDSSTTNLLKYIKEHSY